MTEQPWEVIRRAADTLEERAKAAPRGPSDDVPVIDGDDGTGGCLNSDTAAWIATMSPAVAGPLVAWLRQTARQLEYHHPIWETTRTSGMPGPARTAEEVADLTRHHFGHVLAFARAVLGEQT